MQIINEMKNVLVGGWDHLKFMIKVLFDALFDYRVQARLLLLISPLLIPTIPRISAYV